MLRSNGGKGGEEEVKLCFISHSVIPCCFFIFLISIIFVIIRDNYSDHTDTSIQTKWSVLNPLPSF